MSLRQHYQQCIQEKGYEIDEAQQKIVAYLEGVGEALSNSRRSGFFKRSDNDPIRGAYIWGGVGRGKTFLVDMFFESIDFDKKLRQHFHRFMLSTHDAIKIHQGEQNPLKAVAKDLSQQCRLLVLDEFFVSDITDAMILHKLLNWLFAEGVVLITTSNIPPQNLYKGGLQRERFLPTIELIKEQCEVLHLSGEKDYRLEHLAQLDLYVVDQGHGGFFRKRFLELTNTEAQPGRLNIAGRPISHLGRNSGVIWFSFETLCETERSNLDYTELARVFHTLILSGVSKLKDEQRDITRRFINLIDTLYDHRVVLICSATEEPENLYSGNALKFEFERTVSRLREMRSTAYLKQHHRC